MGDLKTAAGETLAVADGKRTGKKYSSRGKLTAPARLFAGILCFAVFLTILPLPAGASDEEPPTIKVAMSDDQSIIIERILYEALRRCGYQMVASVTGMRTAIADVNFGDAGILPMQTAGWEERYENLVQVPVAIDNVEYTAYTRSEDPSRFFRWEDLAGLRLGHRWQNQYVADNIYRAGASEIVTVIEISDLWDSLLGDETDAVVLPRLGHFEYRFPQGVRRAGVVEQQPVYTYINRAYSDLVKPLEEAYLQMIADGTMDAIKNSENLSGNKGLILHINSYTEQLEWERSQMDSIRGYLEQGAMVSYRSINLNSNELHSQANFFSVVSTLIRTDYMARYPDLVVASGNEALEFVLSNYFLLFPNAPVLFFGVQGFSDSTLYGLEEYVTGVTMRTSFNETAAEMLRLYPETRRILVLNDYYNARSMLMRAEIVKSNAASGLSYELVFSENKPLDDILEDIRELGPDTLVLIGSFLSDVNRTFYSETDIQRLVSAASAKPVFCLTASYLGHGTFGGLVADSEDYNLVVSGMAAELLSGTAPSQIPVFTDPASLNRWSFDHGTARRFRIDVNALPAGHTVVNRTMPIWESNPLEYRMGIVVACLLLLIIGGLIMFSRMLSKKQAAAEAASVAKSAFLANMSHEIRTPLNAIVGMTSIGMAATDPERVKYSFVKIGDASKHLLGVINDILDMSKIEAGKFELSQGTYEFESMLRRVVGVFNFRVDERKQKFSVNIDGDIPKYLTGDDQRVAQVITNLLSNAVKFTPEYGVISLDAKLVGEDDGVYTIRFTVADNGIGISPAQQARIFQAFQQAESDTTRKFGGTGLGLAISKNIVEMMGGELWVDSEPGEGSTFSFSIQATRGADKKWGAVADAINEDLELNLQQTAEAKARVDKVYPGRSILLAEDVEINREIVISLLEPTLLTIDCAENGEEAVRMFSEAPDKYGMVFMDLQMPVMDGYQATERIRALQAPNAKTVPIIAMTANVFREDIEKCMKAGMNGHLGKPLDISEVLKQLEKYLEGGSPGQPAAGLEGYIPEQRN